MARTPPLTAVPQHNIENVRVSSSSNEVPRRLLSDLWATESDTTVINPVL